MTDRVFGFDGFAGRWRLTRQIDDRKARQIGGMEGEAAFVRDGQGYLYSETGVLRLPDQPPLTATRRYIWAELPGMVEVRFADGRVFHRFELGKLTAEATHDCPPDMYQVCYDFNAWPAWQSEWRVKGPRKDYIMVSNYTEIR
jgi:hypothetical protein